jgi:hypothetical protein
MPERVPHHVLACVLKDALPKRSESFRREAGHMHANNDETDLVAFLGQPCCA